MTGKHTHRPKWRTVLITLAAVCAVAAVLLGVAAALGTAQLNAGAVPIVSTPPAALSATPEPRPSLQLLTGEPEDIGEDAELPTAAPTQQPIYSQPPQQPDVIRILVVGQDVYPGQTGRGRSDAMMLLTYQRKLGTATMTSIMRDSWVPIEGHGWNRINAAYSFGGIGLAVNTINKLFDLDIQNYVILDFNGLVELIDKIGGIDVPLTPVEVKYYNRTNDLKLKAGVNHLNGELTLMHARNRKSNGGDFERVRRQQDVMMAVYDKLSQNKDPAALTTLLSFCLQRVKTNMSPEQLLSLMLEAVDKGELEVDQSRIPVDGSWRYARKDGRSVLAIDIEENKRFLHDSLPGG